MKGRQFRNNSKLNVLVLLSCLLIVPIIPHTILNAQTRGTITGRIIDVDSKEYLPGANIILQGTAFGTASDRSGYYRLGNIPPGSYSLMVSYIGYEDQSFDVTITDQSYSVNQDIELKPSNVKLQEVQIFGLRHGQTKALNIQKSSDNIMNVVSEEQMEKFPDINSAEVLQRVPGITIQRDQGEGRYVQVRGTEPRLNLMKINGEQIPSPEGDNRQVQMDIIPADQLSSIEVVKTTTPDMDGNVIGGSVNLVTKNALDYENDVFHVTAGSGYSDITSDPLYQGSIHYGTILGEKRNIGIMLSASYLRTDYGSHNNEIEWANAEDLIGNEIPWALDDLQLRAYQLRRDRLGFSAGLDFRPDNNNKYSINGIYDYYLDVESRHQLRIRPGKGDYVSATEIEGAQMLRHLKARDQAATLYSIMGRGENYFGGLVLDYSAAYSYAEEKEDNHFEPTFDMNQDVNLTLNLADTDNPQYMITSLEAGYEMNPANFELADMEWHDNLTTNTDFSGSVNLKIPYSLGKNQADVKLGGKVSIKSKDRVEKIWVHEWIGDNPILLSQFTSDFDPGDFLDGKYTFGPTVDVDKMASFYEANKDGNFPGELNIEDSDGATYDATEHIYGFYAMTTINIDNMMVLAGVRNEITKTEYTGNEVIFDEAGDYEATNSITAEKSYNHFLPSVQLRLKLSSQSNIRAAFTSGIARANYFELTPYSLVFREDNEIEKGNPELEPTTAYGFDLLAEYYFQGIGVISGGVFYKSLDKIIYPSFYQQSGGIYDGYDIIQSINGGNAKLYGFELNWQQQLTFLPGFLEGMGIFLNYTFTDSEADLVGREKATLPGQAGNTANIALSYQGFGFTGQISMNYHSKYIDVVGASSDEDIYYDDHIQFDFSANQEILKGFNVYLQLMNLSNAPLRYYIGKTTRPVQREFYSWRLQAGIKLDVL